MFKKFKEKFYDTFVHDIYISIIYIFYPLILKRNGINRSKPKDKLISFRKDKRIVVTLTTIPERIKTVHKAIFAIFNQEVKPDIVVLYLSKELFPKEDGEITEELKYLQTLGLTIKFCKDIKSYTKLMYALKEYKNDLIITADDDRYYDTKWIKRLYDASLENPDCVCAYAISKYVFENKIIKEVPLTDYKKQKAIRLYTGGKGALFPPNCFSKDVFDKSGYLGLCAKHDDVWFTIMLMVNNTFVIPLKPSAKRNDVEWTQESTPALWRYNLRNNKEQEQMNAVATHYIDKLKDYIN